MSTRNTIPAQHQTDTVGAVSLYDYYYEKRQSEYWRIKAERYQLDCQSLKQERNNAWKD